MSRQFGLRTSGTAPGAQLRSRPPIVVRGLTHDNSNLPPLPAQSLRPDPLAAATRERATISFVTVLLSLTFLAPLVLAWAMIKFR